MNKKLISLAAAAVMSLAAVPLSASAQQENAVPFEITRPENVSMIQLGENDSENTIEIHYSQSNAMSEWSSRKESDYDNWLKEINDLGFDDVWITTQIDWSIDSQDDWKADEYWITDGYDKDFHQHLGEWAYTAQSYSAETTMSEWIFRYMGNIDDPEDTRWYGHHEGSDDYKGWGDVLKPDQYTKVKNEDETNAKLDLENHTIYARVRWLVTLRPLDGNDRYVTSDWSDVAAIGKDAVKAEPLKQGDIAAPVISDLKYTDEDFNGFPVIAFKLDVDDKLAAQAAQVSGTQGGISLEVEARVAGTEEWISLQGDWIIKAGDMTAALQALAEKEQSVKKDTPIELRARYRCSQAGVEEDIFSDYSQIITFGSQDMEVTTQKVEESSIPDDESKAETTTTKKEKTKDKEKDDKCSLCGFCPQPLGLCIFIWIAIIVVIVIIIVVIVLKKKKNKDNESK